MTKNFDPILTEVMRHELTSASEEMNITMKQTTRSIVAKEGGDYSAGLLGPDGLVIAQAVPYGLGYFSAVMPHILKKYRGQFHPGDVIISNDPYGGLSHLPDIALVMPIFWRGEHRGFAAVVQHHTDIGGRFPGGMGLPCGEIYEEGLRLPAVRLYENDRPNEAVREIIAAAVRAPDDGQGTRVDLVVTLVVNGDTLTVDFTGTGPQVANALNCPPDLIANFVGNNIFIALLGSSDVAINSGLFAPLSAIIPEGTVLNPRFPAAVGSRGQLLWRVYDLVCQALAIAIPDRMPAAAEGGVSMMVYTTANGREGGSSMMTEMYASGWGGRPTSDGIDGMMPVAMTGFRTNSGEVFEQELPVMLDGFGFIPDSAGAGLFRGALAVYRRWRFLANGRVMLRTCRVDSLPYGLAGGNDGRPFKAILTSDGKETELPHNIMLDFQVNAGDVLTHIQPSAGGYGPAFTRDMELVLQDVCDEKVTRQGAAGDYGVAIDENLRIDLARTMDLRRGRAD
jgi:N-methylhydantoinase B